MPRYFFALALATQRRTASASRSQCAAMDRAHRSSSDRTACRAHSTSEAFDMNAFSTAGGR